MKTRFLLAALFLATGTVLPAAPEKKDPIEVAMDKAIEKDPSTAGMVQAAAQAEEKWQKAIDRALANLKEEMAPEQWTALQASQQPWRAYHEKEHGPGCALRGDGWIDVESSGRIEGNGPQARASFAAAGLRRDTFRRLARWSR